MRELEFDGVSEGRLLSARPPTTRWTSPGSGPRISPPRQVTSSAVDPSPGEGVMTRLSRREALRMLAGTGAVTALGPLVRSGAARAAEVPRRGGQVVVGLSQEPTVFNPLRPHIEVDRGVHFGIFDSLWRTDERAQFIPNLAVEVPSVKNGGIAKNGREYTFRLKKGVAWHDGTPFSARDVKFTWELVTNPKFGAFTRGGFDVTGLQGISAEFYAEAKALPGVTLHLHHSPSVEYIYFNYGKPWFKERPVRQALYHAMDKRAIIEQVYYGVPKPVEGYLPSTSWAYNADLPKHEYNPEKAKQILDEAGWRPGPDGVRAKGGVRLGFTNSTTSGNKLREQAQALLQQNWRAVGVDMQISNMPAAVIWGEFYVKSKFDSLMVGIQASVGDDPDCLNRIHSKYIAAETGSGRNVSQYKHPQVDRLLEDGVREVDRARRRAIYLKVQEVLRADLAYLPIFSYVRIEGVKEGLLNYKPNSNVLHNTWNMYEWGWKA